MAEQKVNEEIDHTNEAFYANNFAFWLNGNEVTIDFRQSTARNDAVGAENILSVVSKHRTIVIPPQIAKMFAVLLKEQIDDLEKKHGEIKLPEGWRSTKPVNDKKSRGSTESYR